MVVEIVVSACFPDVEVTDSSGNVRQAILGAEGGHDGRDDVGAVEGAEVTAIGGEGIRHGTSCASMKESDTSGDSHVAGTLGTVMLNHATLATEVGNGVVLSSDGSSVSIEGGGLSSDRGLEIDNSSVTVGDLGSKVVEGVTEVVDMDGHRST